MSRATLCIPTGRHENLKPGSKCANCGMSYESHMEIKKIIEKMKEEKP